MKQTWIRRSKLSRERYQNRCVLICDVNLCHFTPCIIFYSPLQLLIKSSCRAPRVQERCVWNVKPSSGTNLRQQQNWIFKTAQHYAYVYTFHRFLTQLDYFNLRIHDYFGQHTELHRQDEFNQINKTAFWLTRNLKPSYDRRFRNIKQFVNHLWTSITFAIKNTDKKPKYFRVFGSFLQPTSKE